MLETVMETLHMLTCVASLDNPTARRQAALAVPWNSNTSLTMLLIKQLLSIGATADGVGYM